MENFLKITSSLWATLVLLMNSMVIASDKEFYHSKKNDTLAYEKLMINKTLPTPCDQKMHLFTLGKDFSNIGRHNKSDLAPCPWYKIPIFIKTEKF